MRWQPDLEFKKDPSDVIDFVLNFTPLLQGDTVNTATVSGENITVDYSVSGNNVTIFVSGGVAGTVAKVKTTVVTSNATPRTFERSFKVRIENL